jgi:type I restriction enzyme R subunit
MTEKGERCRLYYQSLYERNQPELSKGRALDECLHHFLGQRPAGIRTNENHVAIAKLKFNRPLTPSDLEHFVYESEPVQSREQCYGADQPLTLLIRSLVGLDRNAAKQAFGLFLDENRYSSQQIRFVEMIIERLTRQGVMEAGQLYEPPFTALHHEGLDGSFGNADANAIVAVIAAIKRSAAA